MDNDDEIERLTNSLMRIPAGVRASTDQAWSRPNGIKVVDCVLSLNRNYDQFVVPRLNRLTANHPKLQSVSDLSSLISRFPSPHEFCVDELNYRHEDRARILRAVVDYLLVELSERSSVSEDVALTQWATETKPTEYTSLGIKGFKIAGFQYLRMLYGASTAKPDVHILAFVEESIGRKPTPTNALLLLEAAAARTGHSLRDVDTSIWEFRAR